MIFSSQISLNNLVQICSALRVGHGAGLSLVDVFEQQGRRGPFAARSILSQIAERLRAGEALEDVLRTHTGHFPPLFISMVTVGEQTGNLPEIFKELERYYRMQLTLRRQFLTQIAWPVIELFLAVGAITFMILILGMIAPDDAKPFDPLGFGVGVGGAVRFLGTTTVFFGGIALIYFVATRALGQKAAVHRFLLSVPGLGPCLQALALSRLCLALHLTMDSSLPTPKAVKRSLFASGNGAYEACSDQVASDVKRGGEISEAFGKCSVFPEEFVSAVHSGEVSGQLPEVMGRQAEHYHEEASMKLTILNRLASVGVLLFCAALIAFAILRMAMKVMGIYDAAGSTDLSKPLY
jgi:type IV pilus assembly protein PilC